MTVRKLIKMATNKKPNKDIFSVGESEVPVIFAKVHGLSLIVQLVLLLLLVLLFRPLALIKLVPPLLPLTPFSPSVPLKFCDIC